MLIKLSSGDIGIGRPTDFAIYSSGGKLLLQMGHVIDSEELLARLYLIGHREGAAASAMAGIRPANEPTPADDRNRNQLLFSTVHLDANQTGEISIASRKGLSLPNLRQRVEFFHLSFEGGTDVLRMELAGVIPDEALIARHTGKDAPPLATGMIYEARLFTGSRVFKFDTRLLPESSGPLGCHFLKYPEVVSQSIVRRHHRVPVSIVGKLHTSEYQRPPVDVLVENMSSIGAGISAGEDVLSVGQSARLAMKFSIDSRTRLVAVVVEVRNRRQEGNRFRFGLEFVQMTDEIRRDIKDFVLERIAAT